MELLCLSVRDETADVRTYRFAAADGATIAFRAGQAVTLTLAVDGEELRRSFSIASAAAADAIELTIKDAPEGRGTAWLRRSLRPGMRIASSMPHGRFVLPDAPGPIVLASAGSGATALMSMLRTLAARGSETDVAWVHAARSPADVLFGAELSRLQAVLPRLSVSVSASRPTPGWFGYRGRLTRRVLSVMVPDLASRTVFCCGPTGFMDAVRRIHAAEGGDPAHFQVEHFAAASRQEPPSAATTPAGEFQVSYAGRLFPADARETLLQAASRAKIVIPCGCGQGLCGTCKVRLADGTVAMAHDGGLRPEEEREGWILACSARPRSDLVLG